MSDTPKTDALWESYRTRTLKSIDDPVAEFSHLARTLETDLNATVHDMNLCRCEIIPKLERDLSAALSRVAELEEAGDLMCKYYFVYGPESVMAKEAWLKAKGQQ